MKKKILFICIHNSARSQMAEGYMTAKYGDRYKVFSGGPGLLPDRLFDISPVFRSA
jgi:arsenate reductase